MDIEVGKYAKSLELPKDLHVAQFLVGIASFSAYSRDLEAGGQVEQVVFRPLVWLEWGW